MNNLIKILKFFFVILFLTAAPMLVLSSAGDPGEIFNLGQSARAMALSGAISAASQDATALYYNPASLGLMAYRNVVLSHSELFEGSSFNYVGYGHALENSGFAVGLARLASGSFVGKSALNNPIGDFESTETALSLGWGARQIANLKGLSFGGGFKALQRSFAGNHDTLAAVDLGLRVGPLVSERLNLAFVLKNLGNFSNGDTDDKLNFENRFGASFLLNRKAQILVDVLDLKEFLLGFEYALGPLFLRAGYTPGLNPAVVNFPVGGLGFVFQRLSIDYSITSRSGLKGFAHQATLGFRFGPNTRTVRSNKGQEHISQFIELYKNGNYQLSLEEYKIAAEKYYPLKPPRKEYQLYTKLSELLSSLETSEGALDDSVFQGEANYSVLARQSVESLFAGDKERAFLMAQSALGSRRDNEVLKRYVKYVEDETGLKGPADENRPPEEIIQVKLRKAEKAFLRGDFDETISLCEQILMLDPKNVLALTRIGSSYFLIGEKEKAKEAHFKALELDPENPQLLDFIKRHYP